MSDNAITTEQRPTLYHNLDQRMPVSTFQLNDSASRHLTPLTGLPVYDSPAKKQQFTEQKTLAFTTQSPNHLTSFASPIRPILTSPTSQILQQQTSTIPTYLQNTTYQRPQMISVQPITLPIRPTIEEIHISEHPVQVVQKEEFEYRYLNKIAQLEQQIEQLNMENIKLKSIQATEKISIGEDVTRVNFLNNEIQSYHKIVFELQQEIEIWKKRYSDFEAEVRFQYGVEQELSNTKHTLQESTLILNHEIKIQKDLVEEWKKKYKDLEFKIFGFNEESSVIQKTKESQLRDLQSKLALMTTEVERVNVLNEQKTSETERWKNRFQDIETESLQKDNKITQQNTEMNRLKQVIDNLNRENVILKTKVINPQEYQNKINLQQQQIEQYQQKIKQLQNDFESVYQEKNTLQIYQQQNIDAKSQQYKDQIAKLETELRRVQRTFVEKDQQLKALQEKNEELEEFINNQQSSQSKTETYVTHYVNEANSWKRKFEDTNKKYFELQEKLMIAEAECQALKKKMQSQPQIVQTEIRTTSTVKNNTTNSVQQR